MNHNLERNRIPLDQQLDFLLKGPSLSLPEVFQPPGDELGLVEHRSVAEAITLGVFGRLDYMVGVLIQADPKLRAQYLKNGRSLEVADISIGSLHRYGLTRTEYDDTVQYEVKRLDSGSSDGGFLFVRQADGAVLFRLRNDQEDQVFDVHSPEYSQALGQANRFLDIFQKQYAIPKLPASSYVETVYTGNEFRRTQQLKAKQEHSVRYKSLQLCRRIGASAKKDLGILVTKPTPTELEPYKRQRSWPRVAALTLALPLPGYSDTLIDSLPMPRPASLELAADSWERFTEHGGNTTAQIAAYDALDLDLPNSATIKVDGQSHDITVLPNIDVEIREKAPSFEVSATSSIETLEGVSPREIRLESLLGRDECISLKTTATDTLRVVAPTISDSKDLIINAAQGILKICNANETTIKVSGRTLYIDQA